MSTYLYKEALVVNEGQVKTQDVLVNKGRIEKISANIEHKGAKEINAAGKYLIPGVIDDQVHFREPGLTHKADIYHESRAAVAGGVTSFMEMPNTSPPAITQALLQQKYDRAAQVSTANYSFFMGTTNDNADEVLRTDPKLVCGVKIFMGSSTGNMLVDDIKTLEKIFAESPTLIATHCEDEQTIKNNMEAAKAQYGDDIPAWMHPVIRNHQSCLRSSSMAIDLAKKHQTRLHVLHITTAQEIALFDNNTPLAQKRITSEVCVHHLWYSDNDYETHQHLIKCNPAIKTTADRQALWEALLTNSIDIIATDHAPHTWEEKHQQYAKAPSGLPLIQFPLLMMLQKVEEGKLSFTQLVEKMCHSPAVCFRLKDRGYIREGYFADLVLVEKQPYTFKEKDILYKCGWSLFNHHTFPYTIKHTMVNGNIVFENGKITSDAKGMRLEFDR
jgi:dihydroorotase